MAQNKILPIFCISMLLVLFFSLVPQQNVDSQAASQAEPQEIKIFLSLVIRDRLYTGSWKELGGSATNRGLSNSTEASTTPSLAVAPDGTLYVAYISPAGGYGEVFVKRWDGMSWVEVGAGSASGGGISNTSAPSYSPTIVLAPDGLPYVTWIDDMGTSSNPIYVKRWNGTSWVAVGSGSVNGTVGSDSIQDGSVPDITITPNGTAYVIWKKGLGGGEICVKRWNGHDWVEAGAGSASAGGCISNTPDDSSNAPSLAAAPDNSVYASWSDGGHIYVKRWDGTGWKEVGAGSASGSGISQGDGGSSYSSIAIDHNGTPYLSWEQYLPERSTDYIYIKRWNGSAWEEVGTGSASGKGASQTWAWYPDLAIGPDNTPYLSWQVPGNTAIYVRHWNGSVWEEVGEGSASNYGITESFGNKGYSSIQVSDSGIPYVAWWNTVQLAPDQIYLKGYFK